MFKRSKVCGVGINDADYAICSLGNGSRDECPYYKVWSSMLTRAYSTKYKSTKPTYNGVTVCEEWHLFSNFKSWMDSQAWIGMELDKDILIFDNQEYGPDRCLFVPRQINKILSIPTATGRELPLGVTYRKKDKDMVNEHSKPYLAQGPVIVECGYKTKKLGNFKTPEDAHKLWQLAKADSIDGIVKDWQFNSIINHTFNQKAALSLFSRAEKLRKDAAEGVETFKI